MLAEPGQSYIVFLREGGEPTLDLEGGGELEVVWMSPRSSELTDAGTVPGSGSQSLGAPPAEPAQDWVVFVQR